MDKIIIVIVVSSRYVCFGFVLLIRFLVQNIYTFCFIVCVKYLVWVIVCFIVFMIVFEFMLASHRIALSELSSTFCRHMTIFNYALFCTFHIVLKVA